MITPEFADLFVNETNNPFRSCIQGLANEPITVRSLLHRASALLSEEQGFVGLDPYTQRDIVDRLAPLWGAPEIVAAMETKG